MLSSNENASLTFSGSRVSRPADHDADRSKPGLRYCGGALCWRRRSFPIPLPRAWLAASRGRRAPPPVVSSPGGGATFFKGHKMRNPIPEPSNNIPSAALMAALAEAVAAFEAKDPVALLLVRARILEVVIEESKE
jgi:hypothetical protein